jgi:hypothetical protein
MCREPERQPPRALLASSDHTFAIDDRRRHQMRHHIFTGWSRVSVGARFATVFASALVVLAFAALPATAARAHTQSCPDASGTWSSVTDDQGVSWLVPAGQSRCTTESTCTSTTTLRSPSPGWVVVDDDLGVPWLSPIGLATLLAGNCTQSQTTTVGESSAGSPASPKVTASPYPGWVVVTDDQGVPWLQPAF